MNRMFADPNEKCTQPEKLKRNHWERRHASTEF